MLTTGSIRRGGALLGAMLALGIAQPDEAVARGHGTGHGRAPKSAQQETPSAEPSKTDQSKPGPKERTPFTQAEAEHARPEGLHGTLRIAGDDVHQFQALIGGATAANGDWLVLSGGGENGAYAAGILNGWSEAGNRPNFGVVTGVSTGALIAPFAFVGPAADPQLKKSYTEISAADVFEFGNTDSALTDTWPLRERIEKTVTPDLMRAVAAENAKGRRLLVATTQVETGRPVLWDMGAIATQAVKDGASESGQANTGKALKLFRAVILASTAVPGVFPPVMIDAMTDQGKAIQEMHDDGGAMNPFYLAPAAAIEGTTPLRLPARTVYVIVNNRLTPEFGLAPRSVLGVLGGTMSAAIKAQTSAALALTKTYATRSGLDLRVALIDGRFTKTSPGLFDESYMKALFAHGEALGRTGTAFSQAPAAKDVPAAEDAPSASKVPSTLPASLPTAGASPKPGDAASAGSDSLAQR